MSPRDCRRCIVTVSPHVVAHYFEISVAPAWGSDVTVQEPSLFSAMTPFKPLLIEARTLLSMIKTEGGLYGNHMRKNWNKRQVNTTRIKIHDSSASDVADPFAGSDHVGGRLAGGRQICGGDFFAAHLACWEEFFFC